MGCILGTDGTTPSRKEGEVVEPKWSNKPLCSGGYKEIFQGTMGSQPVAVCVAKAGGERSVRHEIKIFEQLGKHPNLVDMYYWSKTAAGLPYLAIEIVEPIGYDLDRLKNQYQFAGQSVPVCLMAKVISHLAEALKHMHSKSLIHRDLKTENVLVNKDFHTKLIDMGVVAHFGARDALRAPYMSPELCEGVPQYAEVDCWGVGLILHQVYQHRWQLLSCQRSDATRMMPGMPSTKHPMDSKVQQAMKGLLVFKKENRWTLDTLTKCEWLLSAKTDSNSKEYLKPSGGSSDEHRVSLQLYQSSQPMPTALAVTITSKNHAHLIGVPLCDLQLGKELGVTVLLIKQTNGTFVTLPGADTKITRGDWMYFGVPQGEGFSDAVEGLEAKLRGEEAKPSASKSVSHEDSGRFRPLSKKEVVEAGHLVEFAMEFDCFVFPKHIGDGDDGVQAGPNGLDMRRRLKVNLVGIEREDGEREVEWFPSGTSTVKPGNLGLVMRAPCPDGSSRPTLADKDLELLMKKELLQSDQR